MRVNTTRIIYMRNQLSQALKGIWEYPLTVVEAPMGYGKTTAVKEFLKDSDAKVLWHTLADDSASGFWRGLCRMLKKINANCADRLVELGVPTDSVFMDAAMELIGSVVFSERTVIAFDDYHLLSSKNVEQFIEHLVKMSPLNLHIIIVSRTTFGENTTELALKGFCQVIGKSNFEFTQSEIVDYYKLCGIRLRSDEAAELYAYTEGWISALYLSLLSFLREGRVERQVSLSELIEKTVYRQCPAAVKEFLLTICVFDSFTLAQARAMCPQGNAGTTVRYLMYNNAFIKFDQYNKTYQLHNIFTSYLREQLEGQGAQRQRAVLRAAGNWYVSSGDYIHAMDCFYQAGDYDNLLLAFETDNGYSANIEYKEKIIRYFTGCSAETKKKHPLACLIYAKKLYEFNERDLYVAQCQEAREYIEEIHDEKTKKLLLGECELVKSFSRNHDIRGMAEHIAKAHELLGGPSKLFNNKNFMTFGTPSVLHMFYRQSGALEQSVKELLEFLPLYSQITSGHGVGGEYVMQAEWYFSRGDFENAGIILHKAKQPARASRQTALLLCCLFLEIRLALVKGDPSALWNVLRHTRTDIEQHGQYQVMHTVDMCEGFIHAYLNQEDKIPTWIVSGNLQGSRLHLHGQAFFSIVYGKVLLISGQYLKLLGLTGQFISDASVFPNLLSHVYTHIYAAVAHQRLKHHQEAQAALRQAVEIAAADQLIMPFVENGEDIGSILDELERDDHYAGFVARVKEAYAAFVPKLAAMRATPDPGDGVARLSAREREVAGLVAAGLSNKDIARKLTIEETTVKKTLQNIYAKLGIGSRMMLARLMTAREIM